MASEQINRILETEKEAAQIEKDARIEADGIMEKTRSKAISARENTLRAASNKINQLRADFRANDEEYLASARELAENSAEILREKATPKMDSVVALTIDFIVGKG